MIEKLELRHLGRLVEETCMTLDLVLCHSTLDEARVNAGVNRSDIAYFVNTGTFLTYNLGSDSDAVVHVSEDGDACITVNADEDPIPDEVKQRMRDNAAALETHLSMLRLYATRIKELS
jgi:hypothetical protein